MENVDEDLTEEILLLGIYDNIHDFGDCILFFLLKQNYFKLIDLIGLKNRIIEGNNELRQMYDDIEKNESINELKILKNIIKKFNGNHKNIIELKKTIINNYYKIFEDIISDDDILKIRHLLYFLIQNEDDSSRTIILNMIKTFLNNKDIKLDKIKLKIKNFKKNSKNENLTYPISYFDDMTDGLYTPNYDYHIINLKKKDIDGAKTISPQKQIYNNLSGKRNNIEIKNGNTYSVGFTVDKSDFLVFHKTKYYLDETNKIKCEFIDSVNYKTYFIEISLTSNEISFISMLVEKICQIFDDYWTLINSRTFEMLPNSEFDWLETYIEKYMIDNNSDYKNLFTEIESIKEKIKTYEKKLLNFDNLKLQKHNLELIRAQMIDNELSIFTFSIINFIRKIHGYISVKYTLKNNSLAEENERKHLCQGLVVYILTGTKRFGDWIQMKLSKKLYFMLQTKDYLCKAYGILIGAPVEIFFKKNEADKIDENKISLYNYNPSIDFLSSLNMYKIFGINYDSVYNKKNEPFGESTILGREIEIKEKEDNKMIISTSNNTKIELDINRYWFKKYAKYKHKYIELKTKFITKNHGYLQN